jgi:hypothetical protein
MPLGISREDELALARETYFVKLWNSHFLENRHVRAVAARAN